MMIKDHKLTKYKLGKFKFKWESNKIKYGSEPHWFQNSSETLTKNWPTADSFIVVSEFGITKFSKGFLFYSKYVKS